MIELETFLPAFDTALILVSGLCLIVGFTFIRRGKVRYHMWSMITATVFAALFLIVYLIRAWLFGATPFQGTGWIRGLYLAILFSHMVLATAVAPLALITLYRAWRSDFQRHRRIARITLPIWLYVVLTGWLVYWMLYHLDV
jgi:putative membrane protein